MAKRMLIMSVAAVLATGVVTAANVASAAPFADALAIRKAAGSDVEKVWGRGFGWGFGAGFLGGAIVGGAIVPVAQGWIADHRNVPRLRRHAPSLPVTGAKFEQLKGPPPGGPFYYGRPFLLFVMRIGYSWEAMTGLKDISAHLRDADKRELLVPASTPTEPRP